MVKVYVGNLSPATTEEDLYRMFGRFGAVHAVTLLNVQSTGRSRGYGFVTMEDGPAARAVAACCGKDLKGQTLDVHVALSMEERAGNEGL